MSELYERIEALCKTRKVNITQMCRASGVPRATLTDLKMGRSKELSIKTVERLADYFKVTVDTILGKEQKETPTVSGERDMEDLALLAKYREADDSTRAAIRLLLKF